jgi:uncharacterized membrane protein YkvA (DUF1232 family)
MRALAAQARLDGIALYFAARHPGTPWLARLLLAGIAAYLLSPIDLIPDFVPLLGYLDEIILLPLALTLAVKLIPESVWIECRRTAANSLADKPAGVMAAVVILVIWISLAAITVTWLTRQRAVA